MVGFSFDKNMTWYNSLAWTKAVAIIPKGLFSEFIVIRPGSAALKLGFI